MITLNKPALNPKPVTEISFPISHLGKSERLPYRSYVDDFNSPVDHNILIVSRDIPEYSSSIHRKPPQRLIKTGLQRFRG
jgi:hypothetical protein